MLCGDLIYDKSEFIPGSYYRHNCEAGRILQAEGSEAYDMWAAAQTPEKHISFEELMADLEAFQAERRKLNYRTDQ